MLLVSGGCRLELRDSLKREPTGVQRIHFGSNIACHSGNVCKREIMKQSVMSECQVGEHDFERRARQWRNVDARRHAPKHFS